MKTAIDLVSSGISVTSRITVRGWTQSERFDRAWPLLAATYQLQITVLDNVIAFPTRHLPTQIPVSFRATP